ncbi:hypothetical protein [Furfurilactobacillus entadae]|uniref:hypothetical protein n=1 Tax=Furfurilactobacillus entadae TaxID=2922307 RepID=UPI0035EB4336
MSEQTNLKSRLTNLSGSRNYANIRLKAAQGVTDDGTLLRKRHAITNDTEGIVSTHASALSGLIKTSTQIGRNRSAGVNNWLNGIQAMNPNETATKIHNDHLPNTGITPLHQMMATIFSSIDFLIKSIKRNK